MDKFDFPCVECGELLFDIDATAPEAVCWKCGAKYHVRAYPWIEGAYYLARQKEDPNEKS